MNQSGLNPNALNPNSTSPTPGTTSEHVASAVDHLKTAAKTAGSSVGKAKTAAVDELKSGLGAARPSLDDARSEARQASDAALAGAGEKWSQLSAEGERLWGRSAQFVRERPGTSLAIAVAGGFVLSRILRSR